MMNLDILRDQFPHAKSQIYLNHAATSPLSTRVMEALEAFYRQRHLERIDNYLDFAPTIEETLKRIAVAIGAEQHQVEFVPNTSTGLSLLAEGLDWRPGDRVAVPACEFPANVYPFMHLRDRGVELDFVPHKDGAFSVEDIVATLTPKTRLVSLSWVQFLSGFKTDLKRVVELCRSRGILVSVDAIQGVGALKLDVRETGIDFLACGTHKWLMSTQGLGFVYVADHLLERIRPRAGWLHGPIDWENLFDYRLAFHPNARRFRLGTFNSAGIAALHAALGLFLECGIEWCEERVLENARHLDSGLTEAGLLPYGRDVATPPESGIITYRVSDAEAMQIHLLENRVVASVRNGLIRFAPTYYNSLDEMDRVIEHVRAFHGSERRAS